jgi:hypothetical protein
VRLTLTELFAQLTEGEPLYVWFHHDLVTAHAAHDSNMALGRMFGYRIISHDLWQAHILILLYASFIYGVI